MSVRIFPNAAAALLGVFLLGAGQPAFAQSGESAAALRRHAEAGTLGEGEKALAALAGRNASDAEARAVERLGQSLYRYGLRAPQERGMMIPVLRFPVPENPNPQPIDYAKMRAVYSTLLADLADVETTLAQLPAGEFKLRLDLNAIRIDVDGDGKGAPQEALGAIVRNIMLPPGRRQAQGSPEQTPPAWNVAFDRADVIWLRGYAKLLSAFAEFALAHDWSEAFGATAHFFFPRVEGSLLANLARPDADIAGMEASSIADVISFIHMVRFPVIEPQRMQRVRRLLLDVVSLSRENWKAILAETDDEDEWLPSPKQKNAAIPNAGVTDEIVANWHATLAQFEAALEGKVLVGHWRFSKGIDFKQVFEEPRTFDLVLWITGPAAVPYLKDGETLSRNTFAQWERMFGGNFLGFAIWFN